MGSLASSVKMIPPASPHNFASSSDLCTPFGLFNPSSLRKYGECQAVSFVTPDIRLELEQLISLHSPTGTHEYVTRAQENVWQFRFGNFFGYRLANFPPPSYRLLGRLLANAKPPTIRPTVQTTSNLFTNPPKNHRPTYHTRVGIHRAFQLLVPSKYMKRSFATMSYHATKPASEGH